MNNLVSLKSDCIRALEICIKNCQRVIEKHNDKEEMQHCIQMCKLCIDACLDCISACESVQANRGQFMLICAEICNACIANFENHVNLECQKFTSACKDCVDEFSNVMA